MALKYKVSWTVVSKSVDKPDAAHSVTMEVRGLQDSLTLARDLYTRAVSKGDELDLTVVTPAGHTFVDWHCDATPF